MSFMYIWIFQAFTAESYLPLNLQISAGFSTGFYTYVAENLLTLQLSTVCRQTPHAFDSQHHPL